MNGIGLLIALCFLITFGPPVMFFILGLFKHNRNKNAAKTYYIMAAVWLIAGGGICATIMLET